ncbi:unnamed protein product [Phyllotreta striolata]|uniref:Mitotic spindle assembly checkpoint protein MAD2A n=1 Tax=Phyllotreta striolata TaxID=444603 RepID=A0A9N9TTF0_PHYSR|nr:unnamed protein product [Phyllotreta striolata]
MTSAAQDIQSAITVKGSADIVCDYLNYGINSILFQRGLYPPENFKPDENYGVTLWMTTDNKIKEFLLKTLDQLRNWLVDKAVKKVVLVIANVATLEVLERWDFNVEYEEDTLTNPDKVSSKPIKQIRNEIREILKQISASVSYLPLLDCLCSFDVQIYTKGDIDMPSEWNETAPAVIQNAQSVKMRSFSTNIHKMETIVTYKNDI